MLVCLFFCLILFVCVLFYLHNLNCCILQSGCYFSGWDSFLHCCNTLSCCFSSEDILHYCYNLLRKCYSPRQNIHYHMGPVEDLYKNDSVSGFQCRRSQNIASKEPSENSHRLLLGLSQKRQKINNRNPNSVTLPPYDEIFAFSFIL